MERLKYPQMQFFSIRTLTSPSEIKIINYFTNFIKTLKRLQINNFSSDQFRPKINILLRFERLLEIYSQERVWKKIAGQDQS